jgi:nucleotidyltransferase substrate binding protein (TIGR01987 family)
MPDIRWKQHFNNFLRAFQILAKAPEIAGSRQLTWLEKLGLIHCFEFTHELAWNLLKDYLEDKGIVGLIGSKDATREAFKNGLIEQGDDWMKMIEARNRTSHTYDANVADAVAEDIIARFYPAFKNLREKFTALAQETGS